jgi:hypothetical protein
MPTMRLSALSPLRWLLLLIAFQSIGGGILVREEYPEQLETHSSAVCLLLPAPSLVASVRHRWLPNRLLTTHRDHELASRCSPNLTEEGLEGYGQTLPVSTSSR